MLLTKSLDKTRVAEGDQHIVDYSVHGLVTIRLIDAPQSAVRNIERLMGKSQGIPAANPDISVTFTDIMPVSGELRYLGLNDAAFDNKHFYVLDKHGHKTLIDFSMLGERCEILCERGTSIVPHLVQILGLRLLHKGYVMLHSAAFVYNGVGVLVTGWEKGGKTETLLPFMAAGAKYLSDEWTIVSAEDSKLWGLTGMTQVWSWHFRHLPTLWKRIAASDRFRIRMMRLYQVIYNALPRALRGYGLIGDWLRQLSLEGGFPLLGQSRSAPERIFDNQLWQGSASLDRLFLASMNNGDTRVLNGNPDEAARRMVASLEYERRNLWTAYQKYRFAFPERNNNLLDSARECQLSLLREAFEGKQTYEIRHPYPVILSEIYESILPHLEGK